MVSGGGGVVSGAIVVRGFAPYPPPPFLVLIQEKGAKENQAPTGGGEAGRVRDGAIKMVSDGGGFVPGAIVVGGFAPYPPHPFLVLIQEKGAKENQAPTGAGKLAGYGMGPLKWFSAGAGLCRGLLSAVRVGANCIRPSTYQQGTRAPDRKSLVMDLPLTGHLWGRMPYAPTLPADGMCPPLKWFPTGAPDA